MTERGNGRFDVETYIRTLVEPLLDFPHQCEINVTLSQGGSLTTIEIFPCQKDYGKVIGRKGRTFEAIVHLLKTVEWNNRGKETRYFLRVNSPEERQRD